MLDRTIPFRNILMLREGPPPVCPAPPRGFSIRGYRPGDENRWAAIEHEIGDFADRIEAREHFVGKYLTPGMEAEKRCLFAQSSDGETAGCCIAWQDEKAGRLVASLHWLAVSPACRGRGLGKALVAAAVNVFAGMGESAVYLHTQPWSYKAVCLYQDLGFRLLRTDSFGGYVNQFDEAVAVLSDHLPRERMDRLLSEAL